MNELVQRVDLNKILFRFDTVSYKVKKKTTRSLGQILTHLCQMDSSTSTFGTDPLLFEGVPS